jgi:hypothetical protein
MVALLLRPLTVPVTVVAPPDAFCSKYSVPVTDPVSTHTDLTDI